MSSASNIWECFGEFDKLHTPDDVTKSCKSPKVNIYKCQDCNSYELQYNDGQYSCAECGIMQDKILSQEAEYRFYGSNDSRNSNPERVGMPTNSLLPVSSMGSLIQRRTYDSSAIKRMVQYNSWNRMPYKERSLYKICCKIRSKGRAAGLPKIIVDRAEELYSIVKNVNISRGDNREGLIAACLWHACKDLDVPRSTKEIAHIFEIKLADMTKGVKYFRENWRLADKNNDTICLESSNPINFIERYCSPLQVPQNIKYIVEFVSVKAILNGLVDDNTAPSIAAGTIFLTCNLCDKNITKKKVASACKISEVTISKCYKKLHSHRLELFPKKVLEKYNIT